MKYRIATLWVLLAIVGGRHASAADWPRWRGPAATGHVPGRVAVPKALPTEPKVVWRMPIGNGVGSPVVAGGKVFYLDNQEDKEVVHAAVAHTGEALWSGRLAKRYNTDPNRARFATHAQMRREVCQRVAIDILAAMPGRNTEPGRE